MGLGLHVLVQLLDFPNVEITKQVMATCGRHEWFFTSSPDVARAGAADLGLEDESHDEMDGVRQNPFEFNEASSPGPTGLASVNGLRELQIGERWVRHGRRVFFERVQQLEDLWSFPGLAEDKAEEALREVIQERPEYCIITEEGTAEPETDVQATSVDSRTEQSVDVQPRDRAASVSAGESAATRLRAMVPRAGGNQQRRDVASLSWQERDRIILDREQIHPCTLQHFLDLFTSEPGAYRRIKRLHDQKKIDIVGMVKLNDAEKDAKKAVDKVTRGAPRKVYCSWQPKHLEHEVLLTDFLLLYEWETDTVLRGTKVNRKIEPDAELVLGGIKFYVELDTGSMSHPRMTEGRWPKYRGVENFVLVVTSTEHRKENLIENAKGTAVENIALFTTLDEAKENRGGKIWADCSGEKAGLPGIILP